MEHSIKFDYISTHYGVTNSIIFAHGSEKVNLVYIEKRNAT